MQHTDIIFPLAKINLGLNVVERRPDGYHNLQTVFYPVPIMDALEVSEMNDAFPSTVDCDLKVTGIDVEGDEQRNLVVRAYHLLKDEFPTLPRLHTHLYKGIPTQAGMGGGSSDCAAMLTLLNRMGNLNLTASQLIERAARLGADCPFFILNKPAYAEGIGERLRPISLDLKGWYLCVVRPNIPVPTREAFAHITPRHPELVALISFRNLWKHGATYWSTISNIVSFVHTHSWLPSKSNSTTLVQSMQQ